MRYVRIGRNIIMKIRRSSKLFKSNSPKSTPTSSSDNLPFNPSELKQMHHSENWSKILKIAITCLLVAIIGTIAYEGSVRYDQYTKMTVLKAALARHQEELQVLKKAAALGAQTQQKQQQQQCQSAKQKLATAQVTLSSDQVKLSSDQQQYSSLQQALTSEEQSISTEGPLLIPYTQKLIQSTQDDMSANQGLISADQNLITSVQTGVNQDQNFISQLGCN